MSQAEIENELRKHGSGFEGGKQRIMTLYQAQPDRSLRAKALAKEYGTGGHSYDFLDGSRGFVNHDWKGLEFDHYPDHQKITLKWAQVEKYIDLMIQSDRYLTDKEKEHYTPPVSAEPDATLTHAKNLIREFCQEEYDSEPDFSDLSKIGVAYTNATDEDIPIQVNVDLVGYRVERYLGEVLIDERQYESLEELTETELEALDFSELVSVTDEELEHYHSKAEERPALLPLDAASEYNALKEQHPDALVGFEQGGQFEFYGEDARKICELVGGKLLEKETELGTVPVTGFPSDQWAHRAKQLWQCGENIYLAGLNEDGTHHQTKYLRRKDYLPLGATIHMEGRAFRVDNSTALDGTRKFKNFWLSTFAVQRLSDLICLEHQLSTIEYKPYRERQKRIVYPPRESNRDRLCGIIDTILAEQPKDFEVFLQKLIQQGYEVKRGKHTAVKGKGQKRFIRFRTLGTGYGEDEIKAVLEGKAKHKPYQKKPPQEQSFQLLVDIQGKMTEGKSVGYKKWANKFNLKEMSKTLLFLQEQKISSAEELRERAAAATEHYHAMGDSIKAAEARLTEIAVLKTHIINYAKTREVYDAYRKSGYSKKFLETHREEITLHKAAKAAFDEAGLQKLPKVKELDAEFAELLTQKKAAYPDYRKARDEMQELVRAQKNVERFFAEEKPAQENEQAR